MEEDKHIMEFRYILQRIKKQIIQQKTLESQNTNDLVTVLEPELKKLFLLLRPIIESYKLLSSLQDEELQNLFRNTLETYPRTPNYQNLLEYYLYRDLIDYPLIIDTEIIDEYDNMDSSNKGMPTIVENN